MWALFARDYSPLRWAAIYLFSALAISAGLWLFDPEVHWYVGASGRCTASWRPARWPICGGATWTRWILAAFIVAKLSYEQFAGAMPFAGRGATPWSMRTCTAPSADSPWHCLLRSRRRPQ